MLPGDLISIAAIIVGFGVTAVMFRVQRELHVREDLHEPILWLAGADYLILSSVALAVFGVVVPVLAVGDLHITRSIAAATCAAASVLQCGYIPAILAHYRIELGATHQGPRLKCEPAERLTIILTGAFAALSFGLTIWSRLR